VTCDGSYRVPDIRDGACASADGAPELREMTAGSAADCTAQSRRVNITIDVERAFGWSTASVTPSKLESRNQEFYYEITLNEVRDRPFSSSMQFR
jgi:hypothetical protein